MSKQNKIWLQNLKRKSMIVALSVAVVACGSDGGSGISGSSTLSSISGLASKGPILGGQVSIYKVDSEGNKIPGAMATTTTSLTDGSYSVDISGYSGPIIIEVSGGKYKDEATGAEVILANPMRAVLPNTSGSVSASVTPLTEIATRRAESGGFTANKISQANKDVATLLGLDDIIGVVPAQPEDIGTPDVNEKSGKYAAMLAAISQMVANGVASDVSAVIDKLESDLEDNQLSVAEANVIETAVTDYETEKHIDTGLDEIVAIEIEQTGSLADVKSSLTTLLNNESRSVLKPNYNNFVDEAKGLTSTEKEAYLYKAMGTIMDIYNSSEFAFITSSVADGGLGVDLTVPDSFDFEQAGLNLAKRSAYQTETKEAFKKLETQIDAAYLDLTKAKGLNTTITLTGFSPVSVDNIDIYIVKSMLKSLKAVTALIQGVDLTVNDWAVTGVPDVRIKNLDLTDLQEDEFLDNNPNLLKWSSNSSSQIAVFVQSVKDASADLKLAVNELSLKGSNGEEGLKSRFKNAFSLDDELKLEEMYYLVNTTMPSVIKAFDDSTTIIQSLDDADVSYSTYEADDGYTYAVTGVQLYSQAMTPKDTYITVNDIISERKSLRDLFDEAKAKDDADEDYEPYTEGALVAIQDSIFSSINWESAYKTFTVPTVDGISISSKKEDWDSVTPLFENIKDGVAIKIAKNENGEYIIFAFRDHNSSSNPFWSANLYSGTFSKPWVAEGNYSINIWGEHLQERFTDASNNNTLPNMGWLDANDEADVVDKDNNSCGYAFKATNFSKMVAKDISMKLYTDYGRGKYKVK